MEEYLAPAIIVAIIGLILQGIKASIDIANEYSARKLAKRQRNIALFVALMQLTDAAGRTPGEKLIIKEKLITYLLSDTLSKDILDLLQLNRNQE